MKIYNMKQRKPVAFMYLSASLGINERKLFNLIINQICVNILLLRKKNYSAKSVLEVEIPRPFIQESLVKNKGDIFRLPKVVNDLVMKEVQLITPKKRIPIIQSLTFDKYILVFQLNPHCNKYLKKDTWFNINQNIQRKISKKNILVLYELCMFHIGIRFKNNNKDNQIVFKLNIDTINKLLGYDHHNVMASSEIFRTSISPSVASLNKIVDDFNLTVHTYIEDRAIIGMVFTINISDRNSLNDFK